MPANAHELSSWHHWRLACAVVLLALLAGLASCLDTQIRSGSDAPIVVITPQENGALFLPSECARGIGPSIEYMPEWHAFGWFTADDRVEWRIANVRAGDYEVHMSWSLSNEEAGKPFVVEAGEHRVEGVTMTTGSWEVFETAAIGRLFLDANVDVVVFRPASQFSTGALLDLRKLVLVPADVNLFEISEQEDDEMCAGTTRGS